MIINYKDRETEQTVGALSHKHAGILFQLPGSEPDSRKLFNGSFDEVKISRTGPKIILIFKEQGKPGFLKKTFRQGTIRLVQMDWINDPILNRSGLAAKIWNDKKPNDLRRRLENRVKFASFSKSERDQIIQEVEAFAESVRRSLSYYETGE
jgi:hypothetical protein